MRQVPETGKTSASLKSHHPKGYSFHSIDRICHSGVFCYEPRFPESSRILETAGRERSAIISRPERNVSGTHWRFASSSRFVLESFSSSSKERVWTNVRLQERE